MYKAFETPACPFCGEALICEELSCRECRLSLPTFRRTALRHQPPALRRTAWYVSDAAAACLLICVILVVAIRGWADQPMYGVPVTAVALALMAVATYWGGAWACSATTLAILAADYFWAEPVREFGISSWSGALKLSEAGLVAAMLGVVLVRVWRRWMRTGRQR